MFQDLATATNMLQKKCFPKIVVSLPFYLGLEFGVDGVKLRA